MKIKTEELTLKENTLVTIRNVNEGDTKAMLAYMKKVYGETEFMARLPEEMERLPEEREREYLSTLEASDSAFMLCAFVGGELVGNLGLTAQGCIKTMHRAKMGISVVKAYWALGIGSALMERALLYAKAMELEQVELDVVETNVRAVALYKKFGFMQTGTIPHAQKLADGTYQNYLYMVKTL